MESVVLHVLIWLCACTSHVLKSLSVAFRTWKNSKFFVKNGKVNRVLTKVLWEPCFQYLTGNFKGRKKSHVYGLIFKHHIMSFSFNSVAQDTCQSGKLQKRSQTFKSDSNYLNTSSWFIILGLNDSYRNKKIRSIPSCHLFSI